MAPFPAEPRSGRIGGRVWLILIPLFVALWAEGLLPDVFPAPENRDFGVLLESDAGQTFLSSAWGWYGIFVVMWLFNTVLGEELLFRGFLLPRMNGAFGRGDWVANGILFAGYHLHMPWVIPAALLDTFILSYPTKAVPERLDRNRRPQRPERGHRSPRPDARRLRSIGMTEAGARPYASRLVLAPAAP